MSILERANEIAMQVVGFSTVSITDLIGSLFVRTVMFLVELMLGL